jgi:hypothetical protein
MWVKAKKGNEPWTMKWGLFAVERKYMQPDNIFRVDGITLHIDETARMRSVGKVLDWQKEIWRGQSSLLKVILGRKVRQCFEIRHCRGFI